MSDKFTIKLNDLNLKQIADSGQIFRMNEEEEGLYRVWFREYTTLVEEKDGSFVFHCSEEEFNKVWYDYFDLGLDYSKVKALVDAEDEYLKTAIEHGYGIRILRQDLWEIIISFIVSQNNNIPRIKNSIAKLCALTKDGSFPSAEVLSQVSVEELHSYGLGYRDEYIHRLALKTVKGEFVPESLVGLSYEEAKKALMAEHGIGKKVADCICVFGLHHLDAFPIDTHVKQILATHYKDGFPFHRYEGYAAIMQQYMFYHDLLNSKKAAKTSPQKVKKTKSK